MKSRIIILSMVTLLFSCVGNFFPSDEETGEAAKRNCVESIFILHSLQERGQSCDPCLITILKDCNKKKSKQLIQF
jgi:hypothetical protein